MDQQTKNQYAGQLEDDDDADRWWEDDAVDCEWCGEMNCDCDTALDCRCGAYQVSKITGRFIKIADCYC